MMRWDIIQRFIDDMNAKSYLEVGRGMGKTFNRINCYRKVGIDAHRTIDGCGLIDSDSFFTSNSERFDVIFIDGDHRYGQVLRDVLHSLDSLSDNGVVILHDCNPGRQFEAGAEPVRSSWCGEVYKVMSRCVDTEQLEAFTVDTDKGIGVVTTRGENGPIRLSDREPVDYAEFARNRAKWLNLISVDEFVKMRISQGGLQ